MSETTLADHAFAYINMGFRVIALAGKAPNAAVHLTGLRDALGRGNDTAHGATGKYNISGAFAHPATTGIGLLTETPWYVVDIDGPEGAEQWKQMVGESQYIPDRWVASTSRGLHLWVADAETWPTVKLGPALDFKGNGGYVVAPPSLHPSGSRYEWLAQPSLELPPLEMPAELRAELTARRFAKDRAKTTHLANRAFRKKALEDGVFNPTVTYDGVIQRVREAKPGERNSVLNWAAYTMLSDGADNEDLQLLGEAALACGLEKWEIERTVGSAISAVADEYSEELH